MKKENIYIHNVNNNNNNNKQLSICFWSVKILLEHRVLILHDTVLRLVTVLFVSHQHNKRIKGYSTVIMLESCHFTIIIRATYDYYPYEVKLSAYYSYLFQHLSSGIFLIFGRHYGEKC